MPNNVLHFAIHADDLDRARQFYQGVFGWRFESWGPPDFFRIHTGTPEDPGIEGALEKRQAPLEGKGSTGFTCTISVPDLAETQAAVEKCGGKIVFPEYEIPTVGRIFQFEDTENNIVSVMQYEAQALENMRRGV